MEMGKNSMIFDRLLLDEHCNGIQCMTAVPTIDENEWSHIIKCNIMHSASDGELNIYIDQ